MTRSVGLAHIIRREDGTSEGVWGTYMLKSAFQPIYEFRDGRLNIVAFEGLVRPFRDGEPHRPHDFFLAVPASDRFHVETLSRTLHLLNAGACLDPAASIFINFDPSLFCERELIEATMRDMKLVLHEAHIEPGRITCEVTEQKSVSQSALMEFVSALRRQGFHIAVDDYGAAESDMERVIALEPHIVKFDAQWITRLMESRPGQALLSVMVDEFASRGILSVFEGIEERWQLEVAEEVGAHMVQGYILAWPELAPTSFVFSQPAHSEAADGGSGTQDDPKAAWKGTGHVRPAFGRRTGS